MTLLVPCTLRAVPCVCLFMIFPVVSVLVGYVQGCIALSYEDR